jgi:hypothetical protein
VIDPLRSNVGGQCPLCFTGKYIQTRRLTDISARQSENFFEQWRITFAPALPDTQIVFDDAANDRLVQLVGQMSPRYLGSLMHQRITTAIGKPLECTVPKFVTGIAMSDEIPPKRYLCQGFQTVVTQERLSELNVVKQTDFSERQNAGFNRRNPPC